MECKAHGDPHFTSFSGHRFDAMGLGVYPYVNLDGLKIQQFHCPLPRRACWRGASMATGTAVQIGTDVVTFVRDVVKINGVVESLPLTRTIGAGPTAITVTGENNRGTVKYHIYSQIGDNARRPSFAARGSFSGEIQVKLSGREAGCSTMGYLHDVKYRVCRDRSTEGFAPNFCAITRQLCIMRIVGAVYLYSCCSRTKYGEQDVRKACLPYIKVGRERQ